MSNLIGLICYGVGVALLARGEDRMTRAIGLLAIGWGALFISGPFI